MSLLSMPIEILQQICRFVGKIFFVGNVVDFKLLKFEHFYGLALSCRLLYKIALPYQYRRTTVGMHGMFLLLRSIAEKPELALGIEEFTISDCHKRPLDLGTAYTLLRKPGILPRSCTRHLHPTDLETISALVAEALLLQLPNVKDLSVNLDTFPQNTVLYDWDRWKPGSEAYLSRVIPSLRDLTIYVQSECRKKQIAQEAGQDAQSEEESEDSEGESDDEERIPRARRNIFRQSQRLTVLSKPKHLIFETDDTLGYSNFAATLPSVEELDISCDDTTRVNLDLIIAACPNIRSFSYMGGMGPDDFDDDDDDWNENPMDVRTIVAALRRCEDSLESLQIGFLHEEDGYIYRDDTIPDLRGFSQLVELKLHWNALFDLPQGTTYSTVQDGKVEFIDKLPSKLKTLGVFRADQKHLEELKSLASRKAKDLPDFRQLTLELWCGESNEPLDELEDELLKAGIKLILE